MAFFIPRIIFLAKTSGHQLLFLIISLTNSPTSERKTMHATAAVTASSKLVVRPLRRLARLFERRLL